MIVPNPPNQIIPNTDNVKVAILAVALSYADSIHAAYKDKKGGSLMEAWEVSFKKGVEMAEEATEETEPEKESLIDDINF